MAKKLELIMKLVCKLGLIGAVVALLNVSALAKEGAVTKDAIQLSAIPHALVVSTDMGAASVVEGRLTLTANKGTDLYTAPDGSSGTDNTPRVLFQPEGDFIFSSRIEAEFDTAYDGAALIIYGDKDHWGKLLFEQFKSGDVGVASTVSRSGGDDVYHGTRKKGILYLKIARRGDLFVFYTSPDGEDWNMVRNFDLKFDGPIKVGFSAQSPIGESFSAEFSDIKFKTKSFGDFWQGE